MSAKPWEHPVPERSQLHLDVVPAGNVYALALGEPATAANELMSPYLAGADCRGLWQMRSQQISSTAEDIPWITRLIFDPRLTLPVGVAGFHGGPDADGMVEIGYRVDPELRRRGYARQSVEILLAVAQCHRDVHVVRASISPHNTASLSLVRSFGFVETGEQWDEEDGLEIVYEISTSDRQR